MSAQERVRTAVKTAVLSNPVRLVPIAFVAAILAGAGLLMLPIARIDHAAPTVMPALFTAVSAVCVTGLITVDTPTFWTPFGQAVILGLIQIGGFGIMTLGTLLALVVRKQLGLWTQLVAASETQTLALGEVKRVLLSVARIMFTIEAVIAVVLAARFWAGYDYHPLEALWQGLFHAVSAFNNAGFALYSDNLMGFVADPWIIVPVCTAITLGGLGFPVIIELLRGGSRPKRVMSIHVRLTLYGTAVLLVGGFAVLAAFEWNRPETLGELSTGGKILGALGLAVFPRTAGFNSINYGEVSSETLLITDVLMFIGGGSGGTAGGIKITTFLLLGYAIWTEVQGRDQVTVGPRSVGSHTVRQAVSVALLGVAAVMVGTILMLLFTDYTLEQVLFESVSAFATVGLSTGITYDIPTSAQAVLMALMYLGRIGTVTTASALALHTHRRLYRLPEERPIIG